MSVQTTIIILALLTALAALSGAALIREMRADSRAARLADVRIKKLEARQSEMAKNIDRCLRDGDLFRVSSRENEKLLEQMAERLSALEKEDSRGDKDGSARLADGVMNILNYSAIDAVRKGGKNDI